MPLVLVAVVLGLVEGITEFLPVSSTGHLVVVRRLLPSLASHEASFSIVVQAGAVAAVVWQERRRFASLLRPAAPGAFGGLRGCGLLALLTAPALAVGYALHARIEALEEP